MSKLAIQIRPLIWILIPMKNVDHKSLKTEYKFIFLCLELTYIKDKP